jgi:hypothetical protein
VNGRSHSVAGLVVRCVTTGALGASVGALIFLRYWELTTIGGIALAAAVFGALVAVLAVAPEPPSPPSRHTASRTPARPPAAAPPTNRAPARPRPPDPVRSAEPARLVLPVEPAPQPADWWNGGPAADRVPTKAPTRTAAPAPDLATYRRPVRTVQCPRCGAFRIDVQHNPADPAGGYAFRCSVDDHTWTWRAGTAWPVTVVASRRRPGR